MKTNKLLGIVSLMIFAVLAAGLVSAVPTIDRVDVDDTTLSQNQVNYLSVETGNTIEVDVWLTSTESNNNVRVEAFISGDENNDISDKTDLFSTAPSTSYKKTLHLEVPANADNDKYSLRIIVSDRNGQERIQDYNLVLDQPRHDVIIKDIVFYPETSITAGQALLTTVRVENLGQKDEDNVKVTVSIPELGVSASDYIDSVKSDKQKDTEELYIRIPSTAKNGQYQVKVDVWYNDGHGMVSKTDIVDVTAAPAEQMTSTPVVIQTAVQPVPVQPEKSMLRSVLEGVLLVLVGLLVIVAIILGVSKLSSRDE